MCSWSKNKPTGSAPHTFVFNGSTTSHHPRKQHKSLFYWDLVRLDGAECLIRTLYGVVEWRCSRYLEWMLSIYVTRVSRPQIWGVLVVAGFRKSSERSRALTRRVAPRMNVFLSIIGLIDDRDTITLWGRRYPLGAYPKVDGIRLINEATKGGAHVFHCFVAAY